ncbi:hypothetical protein ACFL1I_06510 [Candidatus Omnitrophota bacterium]
MPEKPDRVQSIIVSSFSLVIINLIAIVIWIQRLERDYQRWKDKYGSIAKLYRYIIVVWAAMLSVFIVMAVVFIFSKSIGGIFSQ